jgi:phosphate transport system permease protein
MSQVPRVNCEAALALGGTRWGMVRNVILPFGRSGIIGAAMLGLGRALGETIVAATLLSPVFDISIRILQPGGNSVAALIANNFGQAGDFERQALIAAGMALFILTLFVNAMARLVVARSGSSKGLDL